MLYRPAQRWSSLAILFLITTSSYFDYYILSVLLDPIKQEFQVSDTMLGLLSGFCFSLLYAVAAVPIARWSDRGNRRTVILLALTGWSALTALCGYAHAFWQLAVARLGVGMVEPGAVPPSQSLVVDYFPPERRATASAILNAGSGAGYLVGVGLGGYIAAVYGWRMAFVPAGALGLLLVVLSAVTLKEPRAQLGFPKAAQTETLREALARLWRKPSYVFAVTGLSVYCMFALGAGIFLPSFMIRTYDATLAQVSLTWSFAITAASLVGTLLGGALADRLGRRDVRWYAWLPAVTCAAGTPLYWLALSADDLWGFIAMDFLAEATLAIGISVCFVAIHAVCGDRRRTLAIAIAQMAFMLVGGGLGPLIAGMLSDAMGAMHGVRSLQYSLHVMVIFLGIAAVAFYYAGRRMRQDLEDFAAPP